VETIKVVFFGQPNVGKSSLFNMLTGSHVEVGNWPGKTVVVHKGEVTYRGYKLILYDLPGIYGFTTLTQEELVAREALLSEKPDAVVVLVDSTIPERTMNLALQVLELTGKVVIVFTKTDLAHGKGIHINYEGIERELGVPVVPVSIVAGFNPEKLFDAIISVAEGRKGRRDTLRIDYGILNEYVNSIEDVLSRVIALQDYPARWVAIRLLEGDRVLEDAVKSRISSDEWRRIEEVVNEARRLTGDPGRYIIEARFRAISELVSRHIARTRVRPGVGASLFYKPMVGVSIAIGIYLLLFVAIFTINTGFPLNVIFSALGLEDLSSIVESVSLSSLIEQAFNALSNILEPLLSGNPVLSSFIINGVIGGVASILVFLPLIMVMVLIQVVVEDSGLAPRIAVASHSLFSRVGLSGHAFFPFMLGFGCNVPAVLSTRTNPNSLERLRLLFTLSFIPCQARLVVLLALTSAASRLLSGLLVILVYALAVAVFMVSNYVLYKASRVRERESQLLLEVPPFHKPLAKVVYWKTMATVKHFIKRAGTIIFLGSILVWFITSFTPGLVYTDNIDESIAASVSRSLQFITAPLGISGEKSWIITLSILIGFVAKELVISTMLVATGAESMRDAMSILGLSDVQLASLAIFTSLYIPCLATISALYSETKSVKLVAIITIFVIGIAYIVTLLANIIFSLLLGA